MALDQSALLNLLGELKLTDVTDRPVLAPNTSREGRQMGLPSAREPPFVAPHLCGHGQGGWARHSKGRHPTERGAKVGGAASDLFGSP